VAESVFDREKAGQKEPLDNGADVSPDGVSGVRPLKFTLALELDAIDLNTSGCFC
jgi:hypothetical protein